jgi:hypothetical protein
VDVPSAKRCRVQGVREQDLAVGGDYEGVVGGDLTSHFAYALRLAQGEVFLAS